MHTSGGVLGWPVGEVWIMFNEFVGDTVRSAVKASNKSRAKCPSNLASLRGVRRVKGHGRNNCTKPMELRLADTCSVGR